MYRNNITAIKSRVVAKFGGKIDKLMILTLEGEEFSDHIIQSFYDELLVKWPLEKVIIDLDLPQMKDNIKKKMKTFMLKKKTEI